MGQAGALGSFREAWRELMGWMEECGYRGLRERVSREEGWLVMKGQGSG